MNFPKQKNLDDICLIYISHTKKNVETNKLLETFSPKARGETDEMENGFLFSEIYYSIQRFCYHNTRRITGKLEKSFSFGLLFYFSFEKETEKSMKFF